MEPRDLIGIPYWGGWENWLGKAENLVDSVISSQSGWLNLLLGPVRDFTRWVLHPMFSFADFLWRWGVDVAHWVFDRTGDLAHDTWLAFWHMENWAQDAATWSGKLAENYADRLVSGVGDLIAAAERRAVDAASFGIGLLRGWAQTAIADAVGLARTLAADAVAFASWTEAALRSALEASIAAVGTAASAGLAWVADQAHNLYLDALAFARAVEDRASALVHFLVGHAIDAAQAALDLVVRDIVKPIEAALEAFIDNEWRWAFDLLKLLEDSAHWVAWVGSKLVPEAIDTYQAIRDIRSMDLKDLARWGAAIGGA